MTSKAKSNSAFFKNGKTVILPIDHGTAIPVAGLEHPGELITSMNAHVDGYVVNLGVARAFKKELKGKGVCLRTDVYKPVHGKNDDKGAYQMYSIDTAETIGAHAVMNMLYTHHAQEDVIAGECSDLIDDSLESDVMVILEALPYGIGRPNDYTPENISFCTRMAAELGADVVKTAYPGDKEAFRKIVDATFVPVIVLGGPAMGDDLSLLSMVADAMDAGASGIAIGRNVWQHAQPAKLAAALNAIVHGGDSAETAIKLLG
jgi:DhnA family fructose-bisphosphate aldolase class Ia